MGSIDSNPSAYSSFGYNHTVAIHVVRISSSAKKDLRKIPLHVVDKFETWVDAVERDGLEMTRRIPGYHDEPLLGLRKGQRSIRLSRSYRAIYVIGSAGLIEFIEVEEVSKHEF